MSKIKVYRKRKNIYKYNVKALPEGTVRTWGGQDYKKTGGKWITIKRGKTTGEIKKEEYDENKAEKNLSRRGLKGDNLLDQLDKIDEVKDVGAEVDNNGYITLYHRTNEDNKKKILSTGKMFGQEDGLFFSTKKDGQAKGYGDSIVKFKIPVERLEIDDMFDDEAHLRMPVKIRQLTDMRKYITNE